jgi:putative heme-binding domain-containing protein
LPAATLAASWRDPAALEGVATVFQDKSRSDADRLQAFTALASARAPRLVAACEKLLRNRSSSSPSLRGAVLSGLSNVPSDDVATAVLRIYPKLDPDLQPRAIELLTQRAAWARQLVVQIDAKQIPASAVNVNQLRKLLSFDDAKLKDAVAKHWGTIRADRDPKREELISQMRKLLDERRGDPGKGKAVFTRVCGQCHKLHGEGQDVGPDITSNGRGSFDQLLSNVFDPSLVIGASYQARTVLTTDGRVLTGLLVEDSDQRIVLKGQGGKLETIPREEVDAVKVSELSLMPEGLEKQLKPQEIADLFAYLRKD